MATDPRERLWREVAERVRVKTPAMNRALTRAFQLLAGELTDAEILKALEAPDRFAESLLTDERWRRAMAPVRTELLRQTDEAVLHFAPRIPGAGSTFSAAAIAFNVTNTHALRAMTQLDTKVMTTLRDSVSDQLRITVQEGFRARHTGARIARDARRFIGLAPNQLQAVLNFRAALESGDISKALRYKLRDKRFDRTLRRLMGSGGSLSAEQIERMTARYEAKFKAWNASVNARTAVRDAQRLGKHLATQEAIDLGLITNVWSQWVNSGDGRVREGHRNAPVGMGGRWVPFGQAFPNGQVIPGETEFLCRCIKRDVPQPAGWQP